MKFFKRLGIDLGTANSLVYVSGSGIVLEEPTVVAVSISDRTLIAVGNEAREMLGRTPANIVASRPMRQGVIADYTVTEAMIRYFIRKVMGRTYLLKPDVLICVPAGCTQVERRAVLDATMQAGARRVYLIDEPLAAAIGAGLPIGEASGNMIVDIGGGAAEAAVISLGDVVVHQSARIGGNNIDDAIATYVKRKHNLVIGDQTAEHIKITIGDAMGEEGMKAGGGQRMKEEEFRQREIRSSKQVADSKAHEPSAIRQPLASLDIKGRDVVTGLPRMVTVTAPEVTHAIRPALLGIIAVIKQVLEQIPPELSSDIIDRGIVMSGGTSLLRHFPKLVTQETGVPAYVAEDPLRCVVRGTGIALEHFDEYRRAVIEK